MRIAARIQYFELCRQLGVTEIAGLPSPDGKPIDRTTSIRLRSVAVVDDDAKAALLERDAWDEEITLADDPIALREFIDALLAGDIGLARILGDRAFFQYEEMRLACEGALLAATPARRAA